MTGSRSALIVATYAHDDPGLTLLRAPEHDADALAEVLSDPGIGGFDVRTLVNRRCHEVNLALAEFFRERRSEDLLLVHFSCHGLKDDSGELYFAATDTRLDLLEATGIASSYVSRMMGRSRAGRVLCLLDCCYSGAFARGMEPRAAGSVDVNERLGGRGRAVITASSALQFAFEGSALADGDVGAATPSAFTSAVVRGLRTGEADRDLDGWVSLDELYTWVYDEVTRISPNQTPKKWTFDIEGDVYVAQRGQPVTTPSPLPAEIQESMRSMLTWERESAAQPLRELLVGDHPGRALAARLALQHMAAQDDSERVRVAARTALVDLQPGAAPATGLRQGSAPVPPPPVERRVAPGPERPAEKPVKHPLFPWWGRPWFVAGAASVLVVGGLAGVWWASRDGGGNTESPGKLNSSELLLTKEVPGGSEMWRVDTDSDEAEPIPGLQGALFPTIDQNGDKVVYLKKSGTPGRVAYRANLYGAGQTPLLTDAQRQRCPSTTQPAQTSDGGYFAVICENTSGKSIGLFVLDNDEKLHLVVKSTHLKGSPTWLGDRIVYTRQSDGNPAGLSMVLGRRHDTASTVPSKEDPTKLGITLKGSFSHPDGNDQGWLLFLRSQTPEDEVGTVYEFNPDTNTLNTLTTSGDVESPTWSTDDSSIAFLTRAVGKSKQDKQLWVKKIDHENPNRYKPRQLVSIDGPLGPPAWGRR